MYIRDFAVSDTCLIVRPLLREIICPRLGYVLFKIELFKDCEILKYLQIQCIQMYLLEVTYPRMYPRRYDEGRGRWGWRLLNAPPCCFATLLA